MKLQTTRTEHITTLYGDDDLDLDLSPYTLDKIAFYLTDTYKLELSFEKLGHDSNHLIFNFASSDDLVAVLNLFTPYLNCSGINRVIDDGYVKIVLPDGSFMTTKPTRFK